MSVRIQYLGGWGNRIFQYACARIFSEKYGLHLLTEFPKDTVFDIAPAAPGLEVDGQEMVLGDLSGVLDCPHTPGRYLFRGFFQKASWYLGARDKIISFMRPRQTLERNTLDMAIHLRLGDYRSMKWCIDPSWYMEILEREHFRKLFIFVDHPEEAYLSAFEKFEPVIVCGDPYEDWQRLRSFSRVAISMSTFAWWAAFFSTPSRLYVFDRYQFGVGLAEIPGATRVPGRLTHEVM